MIQLKNIIRKSIKELMNEQFLQGVQCSQNTPNVDQAMFIMDQTDMNNIGIGDGNITPNFFIKITNMSCTQAGAKLVQLLEKVVGLMSTQNQAGQYVAFCDNEHPIWQAYLFIRIQFITNYLSGTITDHSCQNIQEQQLPNMGIEIILPNGTILSY